MAYYKDILFKEKAREKILKGLNITAEAVSMTLGPRGQNVIFEDSSYPTITKDGVTVAQQIFLKDKFENMGNMLTREAAESTNREAGDGTTSTVVLLASMVNEANKYIVTGMNPILVKRGMEYALDLVLENLKKQVKDIKTDQEKLDIATISANNDKKVGRMIKEVIDEVGINGVVTVIYSGEMETKVEYVNGLKLTQGYQSHAFINNAKRLSAQMENPAIIICTDNIDKQDQLIPIIERLLVAGHRNMVLFANKIEGSALAFLIQNQLMGKFTCIPVNNPSFGDYQRDLVRDLATLTEATVVGKEEAVKLEDAGIEVLGKCDQIIIDRDTTIISGGDGDVSENIKETEALLELEKDDFKIHKLKERLGKLKGKIANIKVGGASETEQTEIKYRIEDALNATRSAIQEGIVEGSGLALLKAGQGITVTTGKGKEFDAGVEIVVNSLRQPLRKILENGGENADAIIGNIIRDGKGYNALTNQYVDLFEEGIIDPFKVVKNEIVNSVATAGILITSGAAITIIPETDVNNLLK
jgi:chaperonin GroEL